MTRKTWIDDLLERFQHRWETNPQYRAAMSGVLGLLFLITTCACVGAVSTSATSVLRAMGIGVTANNGPNQQGGTGSDIGGVATFPVTTVTPAQAGSIPFATIPASGTELPTATASPTPSSTATATPCTANCGAGGDSGAVSGTAVGTWHPSQVNYFTIHTSQPNISVSIIINYLPGIAGSVPFQPAGQTDGSGNLTIPWSAPANLGTGTGNATITADFSPQAYGSFNIPCGP